MRRAALGIALAAFALAGPVRGEPALRLPDLTLTRADGTRVQLRHELDDGRPVILNFIFTSCAAVCPVMNRTFAEIQRRLDGAGKNAHLVSITLDPEEDTPAKLRALAQKLGAGPGWSFYTGTAEAIVAAQRAFDAYRGDKMNHAPLTFVRAAPGAPWVRLDGFVGADRVLKALERR
jgi:protein SCO1/2